MKVLGLQEILSAQIIDSVLSFHKLRTAETLADPEQPDVIIFAE